MTRRIKTFVRSATILCFALLFYAVSLLAPNALAMDAISSAADTEALLDQGDEANEDYRFEDALASYSSAIESNYLIDERLAYAYWRRANTREMLLLRNPDENAEIADATHIMSLQDYSRARALYPINVDGLLGEADAFALLGAYGEAQRTLEDAVEIDLPIPSWSWIRLGGLYRDLGDYDTVLHYFDLMLSRWTDDWGMPPHYHKARTLYKAGRYQETIASLTSGLAIQPDYASALQFRGCAHVQLGNYSDALADYDAALVAIEALPTEIAQDPGQREYFDRIAMERQAVEASQQSNESPIPVAEFCKLGALGDVQRERSLLLTEDALAPISASDDTARSATATILSESINPEIIAMCALVPCRATLRANPLELPDGDSMLMPTEPLPYVDPEGNVIIYPGETITVLMPLKDDTVGTPRVLSVTDREGEVTLTLPYVADNVEGTMTFEFRVDDLGYVLEVRNGVDAMIKYDAFMQIVVDEELRLGPTSSCPVMANILVIEHWPHPISMLVLSDFGVLPMDRVMACS